MPINNGCTSTGRFPQYFPEEWVQHVGPEHCRYFVETRGSDSRIEAVVEADYLGHSDSLDAATLALEGLRSC